MSQFLVDDTDPLLLAAKTAASDADNPTWNQDMNGPFAEEYWEAAETEIKMLEGIKAWEVVDQDQAENILPSTWVFKCKRFPDGTVKKFKARFCARGDRQNEGIDYNETYAPVAQWTTVCIMLILEILKGLVSKQGEVTCASLYAHLEPGEKVFVEMPHGFKQCDEKGRPQILRLFQSLYGLK